MNFGSRESSRARQRYMYTTDVVLTLLYSVYIKVKIYHNNEIFITSTQFYYVTLHMIQSIEQYSA